MTRARDLASLHSSGFQGTELVLDADGDTSITADTDDTIHFKVGGSDKFTIDPSGNMTITGTVPSAQLTGALPAVDGSALTGISSIGTIVKVSSDEITASSSGSGAFQNTGLEAAITPAATANKILLIATGTCASNNNTIAFRFTENDSAVGIGDVGGSRERSSFKCKGPGDNNHSTVFAGSCILSPNTTSALTYRLQIEAESEGNWYLGRSTNDNNDSNVSHSRAPIYLHVIELLGANTTIST
tara:strand:- start:1720 stop:2451 length:732 start_codon:yes stop_codon:yes gene_type:complete